MLDRYDDPEQVEPTPVEPHWCYGDFRASIEEVESFLEDAKNSKSIALLLGVIKAQQRVLTETSLGMPEKVTSEDLHKARGAYCNCKTLLELQSELQDYADRYRDQESHNSESNSQNS